MDEYVLILLLGGAFAGAVAVLLTADPKISRRLTAAAGVMALVGGLVTYGYGYLFVSMSALEAMLRTVFAVCRMFIGEADFGDISEAPLFTQWWAVAACWCVHVLAFYATSSAAISVLGADALRRLRLRFGKAPMALIVGVHEDSVRFGKELAEQENLLVVFAEEEPESGLADSIRDDGFVILSGAACAADAGLVRRLGLHRRELTLYAIGADLHSNLSFAQEFLNCAEEARLDQRKLSLVLHGDEEAGQRLQTAPDRFGYGFVTVYREAALAARLLVRRYPPCRSISFAADGSARENFEALIIGFGQVGQQVLKQLVMNGQFVGSRFRADVFTPDPDDVCGAFAAGSPLLETEYDIRFHPHSGSSRALYAHLEQRRQSIRYIAVCAGTEGENELLASQLHSYLIASGIRIPIHQCSRRGIRTVDPVSLKTTVHDLYQSRILCTGSLDQMAMTINRYYRGDSSNGALADWMDCDYFSRMSSRASADYLEAVLQAAGRTEEQVLAGQWPPSAEVLDILSQMEHLRWNAFHYCMGISPMSREEFDRRAAIWQEQKRQTGKGSIRIAKDLAARVHACLVPWEELDELSARENAVTGGNVDYKQMDTNNILLLPQLLKLRDQA